MNWNFIVKWISRLGLIVFFLSLSITTFALDTNISGSFFSEKINALKQEVLENSKQKIGLILSQNLAATCSLNISTSYAENCLGSGPYTADWKIGLITVMAPDTDISYQRNSEVTQTHTLTGTTDTLTIAGIPADGGTYDTLKIWFTNDITCADTVILKRPLPCPTPISPLADCSASAAPGTITEQTCDGDRTWNNIANIQTDDATFATTNGNLTFSLPNSNCLEFTNFGFSIPATATITGVNISIRRKGETNNSIIDKSIQLLIGGAAMGNDKATTDLWGDASFAAIYGGTNDLWGTTLTPADVNASNFGFTFQAKRQASTGEAQIEYVEMSICYSDVATTESGGAVYEDWNFDGVQADNETSGVQGVQVLAYDCDNNLAATTYTDIYGNYKFTGLSAGADYRIEFILPEAVACWAKPTQAGTNNSTTVQFIQAGNLANLGLINLADYCQENPQLVSACFTRGDIATNGSELAILSSFDSEATNTGTAADAFSTTHNINVPLSDVGSIWGLAYAKNCDNIFAATTVKTQTEIASDGIGAIYVIDNSANTNIFGGTDAVTSATLWLDLEAAAIGLNLGDNPYDTEAYTDGFNRAAYAAVGKHGIGDIDVAEDGSALFATNLYNRTLLEIPIGANCTAPVSGAEIKEIALPTPASCTDVIRPWAVKVNKGKVYVGMVCSGEQAIANNDDRTGIDRAVLIAYVYEYDPIAGAFGGSPVLEFPLNYDRTWTASGQPAAWYPWFDRFVWDMYFIKQRSGTAIYLASYAQPILSDIEFDGCNMIIGLMDRAGNQFGYGPPPNDELANGTIQQGYPAGATNILVYPGGDLLLAGANADGTWTIESNGSITSICGNKSTLNGDPQDLRSTLPAPHQSETGAGPGGDEFFWGDYYGTGHGEVTIGGLAISQSSGEVISMAWDPLQHVASEFGIGGAMWLNTNTGAYEKGLKLYENNVLSFQKGSGFGDAELICGDAPIEIGNYVWNDTDKDGIQDACESGIDAVVVELVKGGTVIASTQTANGGQYYFSDKNAIDANLTWSGTGADTILLPNTTYTIRISNAAGGSQQAPLSGLELSITNTNSDNSDNIDNDGSLSGDHAEITALTSDFGWVNHAFDFGFRIPAICPTDFCLDNYLLEGSGSFFQVTWDTLLNNWTKPPDDVNSYPYTQTLTIPGSSITVDLTMSRRPRNDNLSTTFSNVAWPSTGPSTINDVDWTSLLGDDEVFRYFKDEAVADNPVTMTMTFSEPILLYEMVTGNPSGTSGTVIFAAYDDSIAVDVNQDLAVLSANTVPPNPAVHPNPGIGIFETASDDPTAESTVNFFAHNDMGGFNWGVNGGITNPAPAPMNFMETYPNGSTDGAPIIGYKDGYYYNLTTASARDWLVMDYAGAKARSISWQLFRETVAFQTDLGNGSATFSDIFSYSEPGNRSAYLGPFQVESTTCPDQNHEICLDGSGPTSVDLTVDVAKTADVVWFNSADVQVGTGNTLTVSMATSGMAADSMETFYYTGTDIASGCTGTSCCPILVSAVSCCPMNMGLTNQSCSDNGTESTLDDYIHFQLNPTGTNLVGTYSVSVSSGTITPTSGNYGIATTFQLQNGSIGAGNITVTLTDDTDNSCTLDTLVIDPGQCVLLEMIKTADVATASTGDIITYTYQVTNNSLDTLSLSDITDDKLGVISTEIIGDTRVSDQLQSLYQFEDGSGTTIMDNSGVSPALDLTIQGVNYTWGIDSLDFTGANRADNTTDNNKLYQSITASGALTVEAWVQPANNTQDGASRIFSLSTDNSNRNFQLMQNQSIYEFRLRTSDDGTNEAETAAGTIAGTPALQHVVYTFDGTTAQFYINGSPVATSGVTNPTGDFSTWDATYDLAIGNENSFAADDVARDWQGEFHLAAVYSKALSAAEVSQNYTYGLDFSAIPTVLTNGQTASFTAAYEVQETDPEGIYKNIASITGTPRVGAVLMGTDSAAVNLLNCDLTITTTYSANCTEISANNFTADWKIGIRTTNELDNIISYQRNNEAVQSHTLTGLTDTLTIAGIPADGGIYDTLKVWFTNALTCTDTIILKRPVPCPINLGSESGEICSTIADTAIKGTVFEDWNYDGSMNSSDTVGVAGVQVFIYDDCNSVLDTTYTDANGNYEFTGLTTGTTYRIAFSLPETVSCWAKPTQAGVDNGTTVQFVQPGNCASLGIAAPAEFCQSTPQLAVPCYINGDPVTGGSQSGLEDWLVVFDYNNTGNDAPQTKVSGEVIGSTWGVAYHKEANSVLAGAFLKRHVGFGASGTGAIYKINPNTGTSSLLVDLNSYTNVNTGIDPRDGTADNLLPTDPVAPSVDLNAFGQVGKIGLGDIDLSEDQKTLFAINLFEKTLVKIPIDANLTAPASVEHFDIGTAITSLFTGADACGSADDYRPFGLKIYRGKAYVGAVCSAETSKDETELQAYIIALDLSNTSLGFEAIHTFPLTFPREGVDGRFNSPSEGKWRPWESDDFTNLYINGNWTVHPSPILSDIDFDTDGSMVLGFIDRLGHQIGFRNYQPIAGTTLMTNAVAAGDVLRVCNINGTYVLEGNGGCPTNGTGHAFYNIEEFYPNETVFFGGGDEMTDFQHSETSNGGIAINSATNRLVISVMDPLPGDSNSGGVETWNSKDGSIINEYELFDTGASSGAPNVTFGKSHGLGDLEMLCESAPVEIGNYVWEDTDEDGIQDACEPALGNVIVTLYNTTCEIIAIDTTDSKGQYYFNETKLREYTAQIDSILTPNTTYYVVVRDAVGGTWTTGDSTLTIGTNNYNLTASNQGSNDLIDSDATKGTAVSACNSVTDGYAFATAITGDAGCVEHSFDIGFRPNICEIPLIYPQCGCNSTACKITIQQVYANSISCTGGTGGTIDMNVIVNYVNAPAGDIDINGTTFTPTSTNGIDTFLLTGIPCLDKDKMDVVAEFVNNSSCRDSINTRLEAVNPRYDVLGWDCEDNSGSQLFSNWLGTGLNVTISHSDNMYDGVPNIYDVTCPNGNDDSHCLTEYHGALRYTNNRNSVSGQPIGTATGKSFVKYAFNEPVFVDDFFIGSISVLAGNTSEWVHVKAYDTTGALTFPTHYSTGAENCRNTGDLIPINVIPSSDCSIYAAGVSDGTNAGDKIYGHMKLSYSNTPLDSIVIEFWGSANNYTDPEGAHSTSACSATINTGIFEPATCICCPEITELITTRLICHGENVDTLAALTTLENPDSIAFVYFATAQTDSSVIYTGGTGIDTVQVSASSDTARITDVSGFTNAGSGTQQYFVYAIAHPTPSDNTCRPYEEIIVNVKSVPTVSVPDVEICNGETATITATVGNTGSKPSLYTWTIPVGESDPGNVLSFSASTSGTYTLSVYNNGCTVEENGIVTLVACDWGDLPDISPNTVMNDYQTTAANNGPVHVIIPGLKLGVLVDGESAAFPSEDALGDNNDTSNDEEGITIFPSLDVPLGGTIRLPLVVMNTTGDTAYLEAWIDWNGDGDFDEINEMVADLKDNKDGVFPAYLEIEVPSNALTGSSVGFRARLSNTDNMTPYGRINSGEVEDYLLSIACPQVCLPIQVTIEKE